MGIRKWSRRFRFKRLHSRTIDLSFEMFGSSYGGWPIVAGELDETSLVYSAGVGEDISFDLGIISKYRCRVAAFDPTPRSVRWMGYQQGLPAELEFYPIGWAGESGEMTFIPPENPEFVSYYVADRDEADSAAVTAPVTTVGSIIVDRGDSVPDVIKMDIEGAEYGVISNMVDEGVTPRQLLVEFHHGMYGWTQQNTIDSVQSILDVNYEIFFVSDTGREYGFFLR